MLNPNLRLNWLLFLFLASFNFFVNADAVNGVRDNVKEVRILHEFYDKANNNNFTLVKYYTTWCSHCKKLKPIFGTMSKEHTSLDIETLLPNTFFNKTFFDLPNFFNTKTINIDYMAVECEIFGAFEICKRWPGYPVVELIPPKTNTSISISTSKEMTENSAQDDEEEDPMWLRVFTKIDKFFERMFSGSSDLDDMSFAERSLELSGSRSETGLKEFISKGVSSDYERLLIDYLINRSVDGTVNNEIIDTYKNWIGNLGNKFVAVNEIIKTLKTGIELGELDDDVKRDLLFQKRLLSTLIGIEEQERIKNSALDEL
ncbi:hypothetical protein QEN19_004092 [Hanseniaspora menglaensis]